ncbi:hypothetical protein NLJ89_g3432 [Agrocybe chaxingu]|uniref:Uncharacterized protein n=1 Tax=Agrocybe chaxingu TaxID=84603 RepID=A0A9W8K410_9AGAR|nr:hypothetical protein NLJ89_g3432 [Agrocybe chaxingu]
MGEQSPYLAAAQIPLIKSPSLRVPQPVELPPDIHPLPDSVNPYFVYPFTLEPHIVTLESSRRTTLAAHATRREAYLRSRDEEKSGGSAMLSDALLPALSLTGAFYSQRRVYQATRVRMQTMQSLIECTNAPDR